MMAIKQNPFALPLLLLLLPSTSSSSSSIINHLLSSSFCSSRLSLSLYPSLPPHHLPRSNNSFPSQSSSHLHLLLFWSVCLRNNQYNNLQQQADETSLLFLASSCPPLYFLVRCSYLSLSSWLMMYILQVHILILHSLLIVLAILILFHSPI